MYQRLQHSGVVRNYISLDAGYERDRTGWRSLSGCERLSLFAPPSPLLPYFACAIPSLGPGSSIGLCVIALHSSDPIYPPCPSPRCHSAAQLLLALSLLLCAARARGSAQVLEARSLLLLVLLPGDDGEAPGTEEADEAGGQVDEGEPFLDAQVRLQQRQPLRLHHPRDHHAGSAAAAAGLVEDEDEEALPPRHLDGPDVARQVGQGRVRRGPGHHLQLPPLRLLLLLLPSRQQRRQRRVVAAHARHAYVGRAAAGAVEQEPDAELAQGADAPAVDPLDPLRSRPHQDALPNSHRCLAPQPQVRLGGEHALAEEEAVGVDAL
eukprot:755430-Hanusia_phi.AAC.1